MIDLRCGDCLELMKDIPDHSVNMILCDLPYGTTACKWDNIIPFEPLWEQYNRIIKDNSATVLFGSEPFSTMLRSSNIRSFKYDWIWIKNMVTGPMLAKFQPMRRYEIISVFYKGKCFYNPIMTKRTEKELKRFSYSSVETSGCETDGRKFSKTPNRFDWLYKYPNNVLEFDVPKRNVERVKHPTQKPVALLEYLIKTYTQEGETVLDNCMGSGSTGVACVNTGRNFIGIELEPKYFDIAKKRIYEAAGMNIEEKKEEQIERDDEYRQLTFDFDSGNNDNADDRC